MRWNYTIINERYCCYIFPSSIYPVNNEEKSELHSYISDDNKHYACDSYAHMFHLLKTFLELGIFITGMSTVWEDINVCSKQYMCALAIYLFTVLSSPYSIIMDRANNAPGHGNNVVD